MFGNADIDKRDAYVNEGPSCDSCGGHSSPTGGQYHYHTDQKKNGCVYNQTSGQHSPLFGFMADGIPIYGALGDNGVAPTDLDECNGHVDNSHPFYHYHTTSNFAYPYLVNCLKGCLNGTNTISGQVAGCVPQAKQYSYSSFDSVSLSGINSTSPSYKFKPIGICKFVIVLMYLIIFSQ